MPDSCVSRGAPNRLLRRLRRFNPARTLRDWTGNVIRVSPRIGRKIKIAISKCGYRLEFLGLRGEFAGKTNNFNPHIPPDRSGNQLNGLTTSSGSYERDRYYTPSSKTWPGSPPFHRRPFPGGSDEPPIRPIYNKIPIGNYPARSQHRELESPRWWRGGDSKYRNELRDRNKNTPTS